MLEVSLGLQKYIVSLFRASRIMRLFSANYALFFGELCAQNPELCANYANCAIFFSEKLNAFCNEEVAISLCCENVPYLWDKHSMHLSRYEKSIAYK